MILHQRTHYEGYYRNTKWIQIFWVWQLNKPDQNHREHKPPAAFHSSTASVCSSLTWTFAAFTEKEACQVIRPKEERAVLGNPPPARPKAGIVLPVPCSTVSAHQPLPSWFLSHKQCRSISNYFPFKARACTSETKKNIASFFFHFHTS